MIAWRSTSCQSTISSLQLTIPTYICLCGYSRGAPSSRLKDAGWDTSIAHTDDNGLTDGQRAGRTRWCGECGDESEQERSRTGGGAGRREQLAPCPQAGAGTRRQAGETELRRGRCGGSDVAGTPTQRPRKPSKRGRARCGTHRTGFNSRCSAAAWGVTGWG
jgi:hypothetical protein